MKTLRRKWACAALTADVGASRDGIGYVRFVVILPSVERSGMRTGARGARLLWIGRTDPSGEAPLSFAG